MFNNALSCQPMLVERDRILIYSELRLKFLVVMREMLEEEQPLFRCGKSWGISGRTWKNWSIHLLIRTGYLCISKWRFRGVSRT